MIDKNLVQELKNKIMDIFSHPADVLGKLEKERFQAYCERWEKRKHIGELFRESGQTFFPLLYSSELYDKLDKLRGLDEDGYYELLSKCGIPYLLKDYLTLRTFSEGGFDAVLQILENACSCRADEKNIMSVEICDLTAPVALQTLVWHLTDAGRNENAPLDSESAGRVAGTLRNREDGFFLVWHFVRFLLWEIRTDKRIDMYSELISILAEGYEHLTAQSFIADGRIRFLPAENAGQSGVDASESTTDSAASFEAGISADEVFRKYMTAGILGEINPKAKRPEADEDVLLNLRTVKWMIDEDTYRKELFQTFKNVFAYDAQTFFTNDFRTNLKYYDIAEIILSQDDIIDSWTQINTMMAAMKHRLASLYYMDKSLEMRSHIQFMWNVNLRLIDYVFGEDKEKARQLWQLFWNDGLDHCRRFSRFRGTETEEYLCRLICYYLVCFIRDGENSPVEEETDGVRIVGPERPFGHGSAQQKENDRMIDGWIADLMDVFHQIEEMPVAVLRSVMLLLNNGLRWNVVTGGN